MARRVGVVAFAFGVPRTISANRRIANIMKEYSLRYGAPAYTQPDVMLLDSRIEVEYIDEKPGNPSPTLRIARGAVQWARRREISTLLVVAARPHLSRCLRDLDYARRELGYGWLTIDVCVELHIVSENEWFCPESTQKRTQTREAWERRERIIRLMPMWLYKLVAS